MPCHRDVQLYTPIGDTRSMGILSLPRLPSLQQVIYVVKTDHNVANFTKLAYSPGLALPRAGANYLAATPCNPMASSVFILLASERSVGGRVEHFEFQALQS